MEFFLDDLMYSAISRLKDDHNLKHLIYQFLLLDFFPNIFSIIPLGYMGQSSLIRTLERSAARPEHLTQNVYQ